MDWLKLIEQKKSEFQPIFSRMDIDRDLAYAVKYIMRDAKKKAVKGVANVTLPEAKNFLEKCIARLSLVQRQTVIESSSMNDQKTSKIENLLDDVDYEADKINSRKGEKDEMSHLAEIVCIRGTIAEQILTRMKNDTYVPEVRVLDTRYLLYDTDIDGVKWFAPIMTRSKLDIKNEYGIDINKNTGEVIDCWDDNEEVPIIDGIQLPSRKNPYGRCPGIVQLPACGSSLQDSNSMKYRAESIFSMLRNDDDESLFDEANFLATILKTMCHDLTKPAVQYKSDAGENKDIEEYPGDPGSAISVEKGGGFELIPKRDMTNAARYYKQIIDIDKQIATFTVLDFGSTGFPLSAVAMTKLSENKNELLLHRLNAIANLRQQRANMIIDQFPKGRSVKLGEKGNQRTYTSSDLDGDYTIKFRFWTSTKEDISADMAIANAARGIFSEDTIRRDIIKVKNPDEEAAKIDSEQLERENEIIRNTRQLHALIDQAKVHPEKNTEAWILLDKVINLIKRTKLDLTVPLANEPNQKSPTSNSNPLIPLFANNGNVGQAKEEEI